MSSRANHSLITRAYIVPGQPHPLLAPEKNAGWASLRKSYEAVAREIEQSGAELLLIYSTQWFSVIGHLMQTDPHPEWVLVDQNWYELGEIPYRFRIDPAFGELYCDLARKGGLQASTVNYHGFPVDTGTVVALKLLDPGNRIPASVVSCNIYAEREETRALGRLGRAAIDRYGKKTIVICVTNLSNRYEVGEIDPSTDRISSMKDDEWNRKILEMLGQGRLEDVAQVAREFGREANADMGFKAIWWLGAVMGENNLYDGKVWDYQAVWGTGNAIVELTPAPGKELDFEKEFDEGPALSELEQGSGLETHNILPEAPVMHRASEMSSAGEFPQGADFAAPSPVGSDRVVSGNAARPVGAYPHARKVGNMLYLSGIGPRNARTNEIPGVQRDQAGGIVGHDITVQTMAVIENLKAILEEAGGSLENIIDVTVFLTDMNRDFESFNRTYGEVFGAIQPTRTTVGVDSLPTPIAVEMKVIAALLAQR
jgi:2-aminophenol/2-amino-5-chlorophenol 1,6-dioxygenase alpha subunit